MGLPEPVDFLGRTQGDIDDLVSAWHDSDAATDEELAAYLGWTDAEYAYWFETARLPRRSPRCQS